MRAESLEYFEEGLGLKPKKETNLPEKQEGEFKFEIIKSADLRERIKDRVLGLIAHAREQHYDALVFLDKSARPISWLFRKLWERICPEEKMPQINFVNIGRDNPVYEAKQNTLNFGNPRAWAPESFIANVEDLQKIFDHQFDNKNILLVDEVTHTGTSLLVAKKLFEHTFFGVTVNQSSIFTTNEVEHVPWQAMPWMDNPGATGVIDDKGDLLTKRIDQKNLNDKLAGLNDKVADEAKEMAERKGKTMGFGAPTFLDFAGRMEEEVIKLRIAKTIDKKLQKLSGYFPALGELRDLLPKLKILDKAPPSIQASDEEKEKYIIDAWQAINTLDLLQGKLGEIILVEMKEGSATNELEDLKALFDFVKDNKDEALSRSGFPYELFKKINDYSNLKKLQHRGRQLRKEMDKIAEEVPLAN